MINKLNIIYPDYSWNGELTTRSKTDLIVWHHSESGDVSALEIDSWHKNRVNDPFIGIGYNFVIHWDGSIEAGRPINVQGAHAYGINNRSIGICFTGKYDQPNDMPELQFNSGVQLTAWLLENYPSCEIIGHRDAVNYGGDASSCPGQYFPFDEIKNKVLELMEEINIGKLIDVHLNYYKYGVQAIKDLATNKELLSNPDEHIATLGKTDENSLDWLNLVVNARMAKKSGFIK